MHDKPKKLQIYVTVITCNDNNNDTRNPFQIVLMVVLKELLPVTELSHIVLCTMFCLIAQKVFNSFILYRSLYAGNALFLCHARIKGGIKEKRFRK